MKCRAAEISYRHASEADFYVGIYEILALSRERFLHVRH